VTTTVIRRMRVGPFTALCSSVQKEPATSICRGEAHPSVGAASRPKACARACTFVHRGHLSTRSSPPVRLSLFRRSSFPGDQRPPMWGGRSPKSATPSSFREPALPRAAMSQIVEHVEKTVNHRLVGRQRHFRTWRVATTPAPHLPLEDARNQQA
jgi:hypothetical protein